MNKTFFNDKCFIIPFPNEMSELQVAQALSKVGGVRIISISSERLEISCTDPRIDEYFIERYLLDGKLRSDIEKQLSLDTKQLVQNIINASLGTVSNDH